MPMLDAAIALIEAGLSVFPVQPRGKVPVGHLVPHGVKDATRDDKTARAWWTGTGSNNNNIGVALGRDHGNVWVLDVDGAEGMESLERLQSEHGDLPPTLCAVTGGGGYHYYWRYPDAETLHKVSGGTADRIVGRCGKIEGYPGLDVRSDGNYVVAPPSIHASGKEYQWLNEDGEEDGGYIPFDGVPSVCPDWLLRLIVGDKKPRRDAANHVTPPHAAGNPKDTDGARRKYAATALAMECTAVRVAPVGAKNDTLNESAFKVGTLIGAGALDYTVAIDALATAARDNGFKAKDYVGERSTLARALRDGMAQPRVIPEASGASGGGGGGGLPIDPETGAIRMVPLREEVGGGNGGHSGGEIEGKSGSNHSPIHASGKVPQRETRVKKRESDTVQPDRRGSGESRADKPRRGTVIVSGRSIHDIVNDVVVHLASAFAQPELFSRMGRLVRIVPEGDGSRYRIDDLDRHACRDLMSQVAHAVEVSAKGDRRIVNFTLEQADNLLARGRWPDLPLLDAIAIAPRMRADGSVLWQPGYDAESRTWLAPWTDAEGLERFQEVLKDSPSRADAIDAAELLWDVFAEFPFVGVGDEEEGNAASPSHNPEWASVLALLLSIVARPMIRGCLPLAVVDARSQQETGKTLLIRTVAAIAGYRGFAVAGLPDDEAEREKRIYAFLRAGKEIVAWDNAAGGRSVASDSMAMAITSGRLAGRTLGKSETIEVDVRCAWVLTGNALTFDRDLSRRAYRVLLDAKMEDPSSRRFTRTLPDYAEDRIPELLAATLTIAKAWHCAGRPDATACGVADRPWGGFAPFAGVVGAMLAHAGVYGFLANRETFRQETDTQSEGDGAFLAALWSAFGSAEFTAAAIVDRVMPEPRTEVGDHGQWHHYTPSADTTLREALPPEVTRRMRSRDEMRVGVGYAIRSRIGKVRDGLRIMRADRGRGGAAYHIESII